MELELDPLVEVELDFSDDFSDGDELVDSEVVAEPLEELLADSRLSVR